VAAPIHALLFAIGITAAAQDGAPARKPARPRSVLFYLIDTCRADHMSVNGYARPTTPFLERLARRGVRFESCYSQAPWTLPSVASILTSCYPSVTGLHQVLAKLDDGFVTLPEALRDAGWHTAGFSANPLIGRLSNCAQGFREFVEASQVLPNGALIRHASGSARALNARVVPWLDANERWPWFLYVHSVDPHEEYAPAPEFLELFADPAGEPEYRARWRALLDVKQNQIANHCTKEHFEKAGVPIEPFIAYGKELYDGDVRANDDAIEKLLDAIGRKADLSDLLIVVTADHGEEFFEHGGTSHGFLLFNELIHVPLLMIAPGLLPEGLVVRDPVRSLDLYPTILDLLGIAPPAGLQGESFAGLLRGQGGDGRLIFSENHETPQAASFSLEQGVTLAVVRAPWKLILNLKSPVNRPRPRLELYDLEHDAAEQRNVAPEQPALAAELERSLLAWWTANQARRGHESPAELTAADVREADPETVEDLKRLGYLGAAKGCDDAEIRAVIDREIEARASAEGLALAPRCDDATFVRRVWLDLAGVIPAADDVRAFLADGAADKRGRLVDRLLASEECNTRLARFLLELTTGHRAEPVWFANLFEYFEWLKDELRRSAPYDEIVRRILTAAGTLDRVPATNFVMVQRVRPDQTAAALAKAFLGASLGCAQCHDHPSRPFKREQFWGVAAFFARTQPVLVTNGDHGVVDTRFGRIAMPPKDRPESAPLRYEPGPDEPAVRARWIDGTPARDETRLREELADFVVADPAFARNLVNRLWGRLHGEGLIEPVEDSLGNEAEASHPALLDALAGFAREARFDLRSILRALVLTRAYERASVADAPDRKAAPRRFTRAIPRPLDVDQVYLSVLRCSGIDVPVTEGVADLSLPAGMELPPSRGALPTFRRPMSALQPAIGTSPKLADPEQVERAGRIYVDRSIPALLGGAPGTTLHALVRQNCTSSACRAAAARLAARCGGELSDRLLEEAWLTFLARPPAEEEVAAARALVVDGATDAALNDLVWTLLNSAEFSHQH
jgi:arylsulfatase A-like enzyme